MLLFICKSVYYLYQVGWQLNKLYLINKGEKLQIQNKGLLVRLQEELLPLAIKKLLYAFAKLLGVEPFQEIYVL